MSAEELGRRTQALLAGYDALLTANTLTPALPFAAFDGVNPVWTHMRTFPFNVTRNPVLALPAGFNDGLPLGLQIIGKPLDEQGVLNAGLDRLLAVRRVVGLRNPGHSLVKLMNPCDGAALVVSSYTHPEYLLSMSATFALTGQHALLLRGTEGEAVADARRTPAMDVFKDGQTLRVQAPQEGSLVQVPELPATDAAATAVYIEHVLQGLLPVPQAIALQVQHILNEVKP